MRIGGKAMDDEGLTPGELLAAQVCWDVASGRQPGLRPIKIMFVGGKGKGVGPSGPSA